MRVAITGSTGLIGSALTRSLLADGHQVVRLVRDRSTRRSCRRQRVRALGSGRGPGRARRAALGEFAGSITCSARVVPAALHKAGFAFSHPTIDAALDSVLRPTA